MTEDEQAELSETIHYAAVMVLHKLLRGAVEIRLTTADLDWHFSHLEDGIELAYDKATGDVVLKHIQRRSDA
jgi:hypothetical protein